MQEPILAIDVGTGTQDLLLWEPGRPVENCVKMVLPSPTVLVAQRIRRATEKRKAIFLTGEIMGGGPSVHAVKEHLRAGLPVFATPQAAKTIRDNLAEVINLGVQVVAGTPPEAEVIRTADVDLEALRQAFAAFDIPLPRRFAVAVQDHGECLAGSNREVRFDYWRRFIAEGGDLDRLIFREAPAMFTRMQAVQRTVPGAVVADTAAAAIWGALGDPVAAQAVPHGVVVVNVGNGHTVGALVAGKRVWGLFEHHTRLLSPGRLQELVDKLRTGSLTHEEVFNEGGHGAAIHPEFRQEAGGFQQVVVTGPQRGLAAGLGYHMAVPFGDMMLSGCFGLLLGMGYLKGGG